MVGQGLGIAKSPDAPADIPLWSKLPRGERYRYLSRFLRLDAGELASLEVVEFGLLIQWAFEQRGLETMAATWERGRIDLVLYNARYAQSEFARAYIRDQEMPVNALEVLLNDLRGAHFNRIHLCTTGSFSPREREVQSRYPLALNLVDGNDLRAYVRTAQQKWRLEMEKRSTRCPVVPERRGVWRSLKHRVLSLFRRG
ncbi:MAG: hypothetical protein RMK65_06840 [Anaerolineae bacterium]|nr:hypothetical protein [Anaerolineae bacterium]MCX8067737.1 hypothetical protein [Anaerolineae bacterium]MDW7991839.1 hypothetical protein [Anaerolineae bacterium]